MPTSMKIFKVIYTWLKKAIKRTDEKNQVADNSDDVACFFSRC